MSRRSGATTAVPGTVAVLEPFVAAGVFEPIEVQLATSLVRLQPAVPDEVLLGLALAARGTRLGNVCVEPAAASGVVVGTSEDDAALPWPDPDHWAAVLARSELVADPDGGGALPLLPLVWDGTRLYLHRYWHYETTVAERLLALAAAGPPAPPAAALAAALDLSFPRDGAAAPNQQRLAAERGLRNRISVIAGGPGTGKTFTVAGLLQAAHRLALWEGESLHVALAAPTGKAAARLAEAIGAATLAGEAEGRIPPELVQAIVGNPPTTLHRLLGPLPGARFRHDRNHPLPHDLIVVDEASMVSLPLMSGLLAAVRPDAALVLVGDPHQLASVEAGSVLRDVVGPLTKDLPNRREVGHARPAVLPSGRGSEGEATDSKPSDGEATDSNPGDSEATDRKPSDSPASDSPASDCPASDTLGEGPSTPLAGRVTVLRRVHRFSADSAIAALAEAIRAGEAERALEILATRSAETAWIREDDQAAHAVLAEEVVDAAAQVVGAARAGEALIGLRAAVAVKVLSATRAGVRQWSERIEQGVADRDHEFDPRHRWYIGRPVMVTANDHLNQLANGDVGLVLDGGSRAKVALESAGSVRLVEPSRLGQVDTWWAMTIHKSQGSEFD
ncbi:MAG: AAA family ATPase, partial [Acidimicrobiaceae bacterium]|nr:AAA family ATPase [Acidimicrobiaceae bacterium]